MIALLIYGPALALGMFLGVKANRWAVRWILRRFSASREKGALVLVLMLGLFLSCLVAALFWLVVDTPLRTVRGTTNTADQMWHFFIMFGLQAAFILPAIFGAWVQARRIAKRKREELSA